MKKISSCVLLLFLCNYVFIAYSQNKTIAPIEKGGNYSLKKNNANNPCISLKQYKMIQKKCSENIKLLGLTNVDQKSPLVTAFNWPLRMANGLNDCSYYSIYNYVDQDNTTGLLDYNCGAVTYDGHQGTDICTLPYEFYKMDHNQVEVIAAAPGTIVDKMDGNFDKNCDTNSLTANYIIVQQANGSMALYWHLKKFSLTSKTIGQTVITGERLGVVGSSGYSTAPHLHFEVWTNNNYTNLIDPYTGTCNALNSVSWWAVQKPYTEPAIIKASINTAPPIFPDCPATETPNEDSCFTTPGIASFVIFFRNETLGMTASMRIVNPNTSTFSTWSHTSSANYLSSYWYWDLTLPTIPGTYTFETIYNGVTCSKNFTINCATASATSMNNVSEIKVFPNPANSTFNIVAEGIDKGNYKCTLKNVIGEILLSDQIKIENSFFQKSFSISEFTNGIYFLTIENEKMKMVKKISIQK